MRFMIVKLAATKNKYLENWFHFFYFVFLIFNYKIDF